MTISHPTPVRILETGLAFWASKTLLTAIELGVFTELAASGPQPGEALRARLGLHPRAWRDLRAGFVASPSEDERDCDLAARSFEEVLA